jgi:hypothetical protein
VSGIKILFIGNGCTVQPNQTFRISTSGNLNGWYIQDVGTNEYLVPGSNSFFGGKLITLQLEPFEWGATAIACP